MEEYGGVAVRELDRERAAAPPPLFLSSEIGINCCSCRASPAVVGGPLGELGWGVADVGVEATAPPPSLTVVVEVPDPVVSSVGGESSILEAMLSELRRRSFRLLLDLRAAVESGETG